MARHSWNAACVSCRFIRAAKCGTATATSKPHCPPPVVKAISLAALLRDLRQRGLLDDVLVLGAANSVAANGSGRLRQGRARSWSQWVYQLDGWRQVKGGVVHGETDDIGYGAARNRVSIQDWHATILHQLGMDHEKLTVDRNGLEERLTHISHPCGERNF